MSISEEHSGFKQEFIEVGSGRSEHNYECPDFFGKIFLLKLFKFHSIKYFQWYKKPD